MGEVILPFLMSKGNHASFRCPQRSLTLGRRIPPCAGAFCISGSRARGGANEGRMRVRFVRGKGRGVTG
jgi:hypothetical protein